MTWTDDTCPITEEPAERRVPEAGGYAEYKCPFCRKFRISGAAAASLKKYDRDRRIEFLLLAQNVAGDDEIPVVDNVP